VAPAVSSRLLAAQRIGLRVGRQIANRFGSGKEIYFGDRVDQYRKLWAAAADEMGASVKELAPDAWEISLGDRSTRVFNYQVELDNPVTLRLAGRKPLVHAMLRDAGLPIPPHLRFDLATLDTAARFLSEEASPCVVKPAGGYGGRGVTTHVEDERGLRRAALLASLEDDSLLIERQVPGESLRVLVLRGRALHAVVRSGRRVVGDGKLDVEALCAGANPVIRIDRDARMTLAAQGIALTDVPRSGRAVLVKSLPPEAPERSELRTVYDTEMTGRLHPEFEQAAVRAASVVGSELAGVDFIAVDSTQPLFGNAFLNEVNTTPAFHHHYDSARESHPEVAVAVLRELLGVAS